MGTINIHLNENQSLEWGQCSTWIKAWSHSLISTLILNPRRRLWPSKGSWWVQTFSYVSDFVWLCVHPNWNLTIIILTRADRCLKHRHTTELIMSQQQNHKQTPLISARRWSLAGVHCPYTNSSLHKNVGKYCSCLWKTEQQLNLLWSTQTHLCLMSISLCLHIHIIQEILAYGPIDSSSKHTRRPACKTIYG